MPRADLDERDREDGVVGRPHFRTGCAGRVAIVCDAESQAPASFWSIAARRHQRLGLLARFDHRRHDAERTRIEHRRDQVIDARGHAYHRHDARAVRERDLRLDGVDADTAVLHVEQHELRARRRQHRREPRREEIEGHHAEGGASRAQPFAHRIRVHRRRVAGHDAKPGGSATPSPVTLAAI